MGLFQPNYNKPGKGVDENAPQKRSFFRFWEIFGRKLGKLVKVNLLYAFALIPTFLICLVLTGLITSLILSADAVRETVEYTAALLAEEMQTTSAELADKLYILIDGIGRTVFSFLFASLWGMGPATAGATYVWRNFAGEEHAWIWSDFKDAVKGNFKQSLAIFLIDIVALVLFCFAIRVYGAMSGVMTLLQYVIWVVIVIYTMMHFYLYPMMVTFELSLKDLYRNALIFALGKLPSNLLVLLILCFVQIVPAYFIAQYFGDYFILFFLIILILESVILLSFSGFLVNFNASYKIKKYMMPEQEKTIEEA